MPISDGDKSKMRGDRQAQMWRLGVFQPIDVWTGQVDGNQTRGAESIDVKNPVVISTAETYFTLWVGTGAGLNDIAIIYFKEINGAVMEVSYNDVTWTDDYHLTIKKEVRPWAVLPNLENTLEDGDKVYVDENTKQHPLGRIGPPAAGVLPFNGVSEGAFTANFWSNSAVMASGAALTAHAWVFENGNPGASAIAGTSGVPIEIVYNTPGNHWVKYTVTDDNGKTHIRYSCVYVFNRANPAIEDFNVTSIRGGLDGGGWNMTVEVFEACDEAVFAENAQVVLFCDAYWDGTQDDIGYNWEHRDNINFVGYIVRDSVRKNPETDSTTFEIQGIGPLMKTITCWGASLFPTGTAGWHVIPSMTMELVDFHLFTEHTTIDHICDINMDFGDLSMPEANTVERSVYEQIVTQVGEAGRIIMASDKQGNLYLEINKQLVPAADRVGIDTYLTMTHDDWRDRLDLGEELGIKNVNQIDFIGFNTSYTEYGSLAPGRQFSTGSVRKINGVLVDDQAEANVFSGLFQGRENANFKNVGVPMRGFWPVFDVVPQRYVAITLVASDTDRGLEWSAVKHFVREVNYTFPESNDYVLTDLMIEQNVVGPPGITNPLPSEPSPPAPSYPPPYTDPPMPPLPDLPIKMAVCITSGYLGFASDFLEHHVSSDTTAGTAGTDLYDTTTNFDTVGVAVDDVVENLTTLATTRVATVESDNHITLDADIGFGVGDPYHICGTQWIDITGTMTGTILQFKYVQLGASTVGAWCLTSNAIYWTSNILSASPSWTAKLTIAQIRVAVGYVNSKCSMRGFDTYFQNTAHCIVNFSMRDKGAGNVRGCVYTGDGGGSWSYSLFPASIFTTTSPYHAITVDRTSGYVFVMRGANGGYMYRSADGGASFIRGTNPNTGWGHDDSMGEVVRPNAEGTSILWQHVRQGTTPGVSLDDGNSWALMTIPAGYTRIGGGTAGGGGMGSWQGDPQDVLYANFKRNADGHQMLMRSSDGGDTWVELGVVNHMFNGLLANANHALPPTPYPPRVDVLIAACWDASGWGASHSQRRIFYTDDNGGTWYNKMGDWYLTFGTWPGGVDRCGRVFGLPRVGSNS